MKQFFTFLITLHMSVCFSQWRKVEQLPSSNIFTIFHKDSVLYAGGTNVIYVSNNRGTTWHSTTAIPQLSPISSIINNIIVYKNELYASVPSKGVFKSPDGGITWQNISAGIFPQVTDFCEYRGDLYASTEGNFANPVFKLDPVSRTQWLSFNDGLSSISTVATSIIGTSNTLIVGTNNNGLYDYLPVGSTAWEERFLTNPVSVNEGAFDIVTGHDTLFLAGKTGRFFMSTDHGHSWNLFGNRLVTGATFITNAKQALISSRQIFDGVNDVTLFYYNKKDSLQFPFRNFSVVTDHFTWKIDIVGDKLWDASDRGLFCMSLSDLPGISAADDPILVVLPIHFIAFDARCNSSKVLLSWKTTQEQNSSHFNIERSDNASSWEIIGVLPASGNSAAENDYSFTDNNPLSNGYYRIAWYDQDGKVQYSNLIRPSCITTDAFNAFPNPVHDKVFITITTNNVSKSVIQIFDSKGVLVKLQEQGLQQGSNRFSIDMKFLADGVYHVSAEWDGVKRKTIQVVKM